VDTAAGEVGTSLADQSEELRLAILSCLRLLFSAYDLPDLRESQPQQPIRRRRPALALESTAHMHFMAYLVSALLHVAQHDRCREAALLATETLTRIVECLETNPLAMRQFLPGITGGVWNCVNAPNQASKVVVAAVECLAQAIKVCLADGIPENNAQQQQSQYSLESLREIAIKNSAQYPTGSEERDESADTSPSDNADKWLTETAVNMDIILSRMFTVGQRAHHQASWRIRCALAELCGVVVLECRATLRDSFFRCFEELLVYQVDRIPEVSEAARHMSDQLNAVLTTDEWLAMLPAFADRFEMQLSTLVLKCATEHEAFSAHIMKKMTGYLMFLGGRLRPFLDRSMELTYKSLCRVLQFEAMDIDLIVHQTLTKRRETHGDNQNPPVGDGESLVVSHYQKRLKHFHEQEAVHATFELLHAIGATSTPAVFIDCAFALLLADYDAGAGEEQSEADSSPGAEVMLILNEFLRAYCASQPRKSDDEKSVAIPAMGATTFATVDVHLVGRVLEDLLALGVWSEQSSLEPKPRVNQRALMVECVGVCVEILGHDFVIFLLHVLYPLVEKLGSRSLQVERAALAALSKIYFLCDYESMEALFEANMDYFVDALCSRLENLDDFPLTALVVEALLKHTRIASLPLADEVTHSLLRSVDMYQESPFTDGLLRSLHSLLRSISSGSDNTSESVDAVNKTNDSRSSDPSMLSRFLAEMNALAVGDDDDNDDDNKEAAPRFQEVEDGEGGAADTPNVKAAMPLEYDEGGALGGGPSNDEDGDEDEDRDDQLDPVYRALTVEILDRSGYFVATPEPVACCQVLALMQDGFILLSRSQKQLLPLIHRLWPSLLPRLHAKSRAIVTAAAGVISTLADVAGDFIASRFVEDVWPEFRRQLESINFEGNVPKITRSMLLLNVSNSHTEAGQDASGEEAQSMVNTRQVASLGRKTQEIRQLLAILSCITTVAQHTDAVSSLVPEVLASCAKFLHRAVPSEIVDFTTTLLLALYDLNGDEVFCAVAALADWEPPRSAPSSRFPSFSMDSTRQFYRSQLATFKAGASVSGGCAVNAAQVMRRLTETRR
jgi:hypothetical protein